MPKPFCCERSQGEFERIGQKEGDDAAHKRRAEPYGAGVSQVEEQVPGRPEGIAKGEPETEGQKEGDELRPNREMIAPETNAIRRKPTRYPPVVPNKTPIPPENPEKTGTPAAPSSR